MTNRPSESTRRHSASGNQDASGLSLATRVARLVGSSTILVPILIAPWVFGGVEARSQVWFFGAVFVALACSAIAILGDRQHSIRLPWALLPLILAIVLGGIQLIPMPKAIRGFLSPAAVAQTDTLVGVTDAQTEPWAVEMGVPPTAQHQPLSLYPASTRHDLALLILGVATFFLGVVFFSRPATHLWLCSLIAANGVAIAFFGFTQKLSWNGMLYWTVPLTRGGEPFGPFVNRNNAGGFLILCFAAAVGLTVWCLEQFSPVLQSDSRTEGRLRDWWIRTKRRGIEVVANLNAKTLTAVSAVGFLAAAILATLSRGAAVATVGATMMALTAAVAARRRNLSMGWLVCVVVISLSLVSWAGLGGVVGGRIGTLFGDEIQADVRLLHWQDGFEAGLDFWPLGSGLGTYRFVYPQYENQLHNKWFYHADNQYLEAFVDAGVVGLGLLLTALGLVAAGVWRMLRWELDPRSFALALVGALAVAGQAIAAIFDFGLFIPANMMLFALLCGALTGRAARVIKVGRNIIERPRALPRWVAVFCVPVLIAAGLWGMSELRIASQVERALKEVRVARVLSDYSPSSIEPHIERLDAVAGVQQDNAEVHRRLAELWIQLYRAHTLEQVRALTTFEPDDPRLLQLTLPMVIHQRIHFLQRLGLVDELAKVRNGDAARKNLLPALKHLALSRNACPLLPEVHSGMAQLCGLVDDPAVDRIYIDRVRIVAPSNPDLMYLCGLMEQHAGRYDEARAFWKQTLTLSEKYLGNVLELADPWLMDSRTIEQLLPDSPALLVSLARKQYAGEESKEVRRLLVQRATELVDRVEISSAERFYLLGAVFALNQDYSQAFENYAEAVRRRPEDAVWRFEYARLLNQEGQLDEARQQAIWCTRLAPERKSFQKLLEEIREAQLTAREL